MPPGDGQIKQDFMATRALAQRPDPWAALDARYTQQAAPPATAAPEVAPVDPNQPIGQRVVQAAQATAPGAPAGFLGTLRQAATGGLMQSLHDLSATGDALAGKAPADEGAQADYQKPLAWGDLLHPEEALTKAVYQISHGAPVLAAGIGGGVAGGLALGESGAETGAAVGTAAGPEGTAIGAAAGGIIGGAGGAIGGGALGAGAMSAAQELGPFYAAALKANPGDPSKAFDEALTRAGAAGVFSAAGWALFGLKPFSGAVKNLMFQAFGVQPGVAVAGKVADNLATGAPAMQGTADAIPGAVVGTALPAAGHAAVGALAGGPAPAATEGAPAGAADGSGAPPPAEPDLANKPADEASTPPAAAAAGADGQAVTPKDGAPPAPTPQPEAVPIGDAKADPVTISPDVEKNAQAYLDGDTGANPVKVNLAYIGTDNIQDTLERISSMLPGQGVQSHDETTQLALGLGLQPDQFLAGYKGQQLDAAQTTAMRMMLDSSAQQLVQFATAATDPNTATPAAQAQFLRAFATHQGIQQYFENARAEAGRTLNAYQMMSRTSSDMTKAVGDLVNNAGGAAEVTKLASRLADLNDPVKVNQLVAASRQMSARDLFMYGYYNIILSNIPHVLAKKLTSDVMAATWEMGVRAIAARVPGAEVQPGEAARMAYGYASAMRDGLRLAGQGIATGEHQFEGGVSTDAIGSNRVRIAAEGAPTDLTPDQPTRAAVDYLKMALPTRWIGAADDFAKYVNYRAELNGLAFRSGMAKGLSGDDLESHISQIQAAPPSDMHEQAVSATMRTTFQEPLTGVAKALENTANAINIPLPGTDFAIPFGRMVLPFVKIPANLLGWVYRNSPVAAAFPSQQIKADLAAGGAARDIQIARMALGSGVAMAAAGLATNGMMTGRGPSDPGLNRAWRAAGNQPYSITIGGTSYNYNQVDPIGMYLGAIGDTFDTLRFAPEQSRYDVAASLGFGLGNALLSKTYMSGLAQFFDALQTPDREGSKYVDRFIGNLMAPGASAALQTATDPWLRAHYDLLQGIEARLPMVSQNLPPDRTLWGDPIPKENGFLPGLSGTGLARAVSPVTYGAPAANAEPIDKWIWDNRAAFPHSDQGQLDLRKPGQVQSFSAGRGINVQLQLTPQQLDRFQEQAGNGLKDPETGEGAKDMLNALVQGKSKDSSLQSQWNNADPSLQALMVQTIVSKMRTAAKKQLLGDFPELAEAVRTGAEARAQQLNGGSP
jgi:hypothetical protein